MGTWSYDFAKLCVKLLKTSKSEAASPLQGSFDLHSSYHAYLIWPRTHHRNFPDSLSMHVVPMHTSNTAQGTGACRIAMHQLSPAMCAKTHIAHLDHTMKTMVWFHISKLNWLEHVKSAARYGMPLNSSRPLS